MHVPAFLAVLSALAVPCNLPGEWPHTRDAVWVNKVLSTAGYGSHGCTGSAFTITLAGRGRYGHDLYVWAFSARRLAVDPGMRLVRYRTVRLHMNRIQATWRAGPRNVWVEAGPTTRALPALRKWRRLIDASLIVA